VIYLFFPEKIQSIKETDKVFEIGSGSSPFLDKISGEGYVDFCIDKLAFKPSKYICSVTFAEKEVSNILEWHEKSYMVNIKSGITNNALINPFPKWFLKG